MNPATQPSDRDLLVAARGVLAGPSPQDAIPLLHRIIGIARSPAWSEAHVELSVHHYCLGEYELSAAHAAEVLRGPQELVSDRARAIAGVMSCDARDSSGQDFDDELLLRSAEACLEVQERRYAAIAFEILGHRESATDRRRARTYLARAARLYEDSGSMIGPAQVLISLARLSLAEGDLEEACAYRDRAIALLAKFTPGHVDRFHAQQLQKLEDAIAKATSTT